MNAQAQISDQLKKLWASIFLVALLALAFVVYFTLPSWEPPSVRIIAEAGGQVWIGTGRGVYKVEKGKSIPVLEGAQINAILEAEGQIWLKGISNVFRIENGKPIPIFSEQRSISEIAVIKDRVWIGTDKGVYKVENGNAIPVIERVSVLKIREGENQVLIGTDKGAYRIKNEKIIPVLERPLVSIIEEIRGQIWIVGITSVFIAEGEKNIPVLEGPLVSLIGDVRGQIWIGTDNGAYQVENGKPILVIKGSHVNAIVDIGGQAWVGTDSGAYQVENGKPIPVIEGHKVTFITLAKGRIWIGTDSGAYQVENGKAVPVIEGPNISGILELDGQVWIGGISSVYRVTEGKAVPVLVGRPGISGITAIKGQVWIKTDSGAYRVEDGRPIPAIDKPWWSLAIVRYSLFIVLIGFIAVKLTVRIIARQDLQLKDERLKFEVVEALKLMDGLFPSESPFKRPGIYVVHHKIQSPMVSGDFYNFIPRGDGSLGIYFVDVEGHSLSASYQARSLYQIATDKEWGLGDARLELERADELVSRSAIFQKEDVALCMNFTEIDPQRMEVRHANAGMPFPLLFRQGQAQPEPLQAAGVYVGAGYSRYPVKPERADVKVGDGDLLVIASDGILEARDSLGRIFGQNGITSAVSRSRHQSPEEIVDEILRAVKQHTGLEKSEDDQTLAVILIGQPVVETRPSWGKILEEKDGVFSLTHATNLRDTVSACNELLERLKTWAKDQGFDDERIGHVVYGAIQEAIMNAAKHGSRPGDVIYIRRQLIFRESERLLEVEVSQPLLWEDWDRFLGESMRREVHTTGQFFSDRVGTFTMLLHANEIQVTEGGRRIIMRFSEVVSKRKISPEL